MGRRPALRVGARTFLSRRSYARRPDSLLFRSSRLTPVHALASAEVRQTLAQIHLQLAKHTAALFHKATNEFHFTDASLELALPPDREWFFTFCNTNGTRRQAHWYRIPVDNAEKWLARRWPPQTLAFYQTKVFGPEAFAINYSARVLAVRHATRAQLFPQEPLNPKSSRRYFQLNLGPLQKLPHPIPSKRWRRIVFIPTTWGKFIRAEEINDLYDESPLEDLLWSRLKRLNLQAERQDFITASGADYALDFALYCRKGKMDVETDGDTWHADPKRIPMDNRRDNDLETGGWKLLRFNSYQLREQMDDNCLPTIVKNVKELGGADDSRVVPRDIQLDPSSRSQMSLFDDIPPPRQG